MVPHIAVLKKGSECSHVHHAARSLPLVFPPGYAIGTYVDGTNPVVIAVGMAFAQLVDKCWVMLLLRFLFCAMLRTSSQLGFYLQKRIVSIHVAILKKTSHK